MTIPTTIPTTTAALTHLRNELDRRHAEERAHRQEQLAHEEALRRIQEEKAEAFLDTYFSGWLAEALAPMRIKATSRSWHVEFDFDGYTWRIDNAEQHEIPIPLGHGHQIITTCRLLDPAPGRTRTIDVEKLEVAILASLAEHEAHLHPNLVAIP